MDNLLTFKQAAKALEVNDSRVRQLILAVRLSAHKFGPMLLIQEKDLIKVEDRKVGYPN